MACSRSGECQASCHSGKRRCHAGCHQSPAIRPVPSLSWGHGSGDGTSPCCIEGSRVPCLRGSKSCSPGAYHGEGPLSASQNPQSPPCKSQFRKVDQERARGWELQFDLALSNLDVGRRGSSCQSSSSRRRSQRCHQDTIARPRRQDLHSRWPGTSPRLSPVPVRPAQDTAGQKDHPESQHQCMRPEGSPRCRISTLRPEGFGCEHSRARSS
mmetsp:Transcript_7144/g.15470  ORF Transcript_7144/g.15470 Transcript_7144/m.15470 type:complete len:212 (+) Transcript_7144:2174-2809(+)